MGKVFRFRSIDRLLGVSQELERQEIYFAHPSELNDPAEEIFPFFWKGDRIIWTNFLRHYLYCLHWKCLDFLVMRDHLKIQEIPPPMMGDRNMSGFPMLTEVHGRVVNKIFNDTKIREWPELLSQQHYSMGKSHILFLLRTLQWSAIEAIRAAYHEFGNPLPYFPDTSSTASLLESVPIILEQAMDVDRDGLLLNEQLMQLQGCHLLGTRHSFAPHRNGGRANPIMDNINYLIYDFPRIYLEHLPTLVSPNWYTACFTKSCRNSVTWASYGDNHKGVCLVFGEEHDSKGEGLTLNTGIRNVLGDTQLSTRYHGFYDVNYGSNVGEIDFFRFLSLGPVQRELLIQTWYSDDKGNLSECAAPIQGGFDSRYQEHLDRFFAAIVQKSHDWQHEEETRLICFSEEDRMASYEFSSLVGVVFGVRTHESEKIKVMDIIQRKCAKHGRETFEFSQAYTSDAGQIKMYKIESKGSKLLG